MLEQRPKKLTHKYVASLTSPGRYGDGRGGHGLSILVKPTVDGKGCSRTWSQRVTIDGRKRQVGLGAFPVITLAMARAQALDNARRVALGEDITRPPKPIPTLHQAFDTAIDNRADSWTSKTSARGWRRSRRYCDPIGSIPINKITPSDITDLLKPMWHLKPGMARTLTSHLRTVFAWAISEDLRTSDPASRAVTATFGRRPRRNHRQSLPHAQVGHALALIRDSDAWWAQRYALIFLALTSVRSAEATKAVWEEIDLDTATWTIPEERTKNRLGHQVPLSTQAIEILIHARQRTGSTKGLIFPSERSHKAMDSGRLSNLMQDLAIPAVPHGFRSSVPHLGSECRNLATGCGDGSRPHSIGRNRGGLLDG